MCFLPWFAEMLYDFWLADSVIIHHHAVITVSTHNIQSLGCNRQFIHKSMHLAGVDIKRGCRYLHSYSKLNWVGTINGNQSHKNVTKILIWICCSHQIWHLFDEITVKFLLQHSSCLINNQWSRQSVTSNMKRAG